MADPESQVLPTTPGSLTPASRYVWCAAGSYRRHSVHHPWRTISRTECWQSEESQAAAIAFRISERLPQGYSIFYTPVAYIARPVAIYSVAHAFALHIRTYGAAALRYFRMSWRLSHSPSISTAPDLHPSTLAFERGTMHGTDSNTANVFREVVPLVRNAAAQSRRARCLA